MRLLGFFLAFLSIVPLLLAGAVLARDEADPPPPLGTRVADLDDLRVVERVIEGKLLRGAVLPERLGRGLAVLVESAQDGTTEASEKGEDLPREVWILPPDPREPPRLLAGDLPSSITELRRRGDELWLGGDGVIYRLEGAGTGGAKARPNGVRPILASPGLDLKLLAENGLLELPGGGVAVPELGRLLLYDANLEQVAVLPVPLRAERRRHGLVLASPAIVRPADDRTMVFYAGPQERPGHRLRIGLLEPGDDAVENDAAEAGTEETDREATDREEAAAWVRLPGAEEVVSSRFLVVDGEPRLALTTMKEGTVGIFSEQRLRLYALQRDRTRGGLGPLIAEDTVSKRWHRVGLHAGDADGDGNDDLVVLQPEGLGGGDLVVEIYRGLGSGTISIARPRRTQLDLGPSRWLWSDDLDGDGLPDLLLASRSDGLRLHPGTRHRRRAVDGDPRWTLHADELRRAMRSVEGDEGPPPDGHFARFGAIRTHDLDGDALPEISLVWGDQGRTVVRYVLPR